MAEDKTKQPVEQAVSERTEKPIIAWEAKEFTDYQRNKRWYILVGIVGAVLTVGALVIQQWLTAVVFALATYVVMRHAGDKPRTITYSISRLGIQVGDKFYPYNDLKQYWIVYNPPIRTLSFQLTSRFKPLIKMNIGEVDPDAIREALKEHLPELPKQGEDFIDKFSRWVRL
ncbi:hypothetical protein EXS54_01720 [Patescibacteria group bacterium]|nr:hypothetical protein [Patescibacteria group bacterium]